MTVDNPSGGYMFLAAACAFVVAYLLSKQVAFLGVSAAFFGIGGSFVRKAREARRSD